MASPRRLLAITAVRASSAIRRLAFAFLIVASLLPAGAQAGFSKQDAVNWAVDSFVQAGAAYIGITIPKDAVSILREMVLCGVDGGSVPDCARQSVIKVALGQFAAPEQLKGFVECASGGKSLDDCAKQEGLKQIPEQARPLAECLLGGGTVAACASKVAVGEVTARSPEEVRPLVRCVAETGDVGGCVSKVAIDQLPDGDAKNMAMCIRQGTPLADCAAQFAKGQVDENTKKQVDAAINHIKELKADTEDAMKEMRGSVRNIVEVAQGIEEGNYAKILAGGGPEIVKIVLTAIINYMVPIAAPITGPIVGALVDLYNDTARDVFNSLYSGDVSGVAEALFTFYYGEMIARPCAIIPEGGFREATCGNAAKAIEGAAGWFGDAVGLAYQIARELLAVDPVGGWLAGQVEGIAKDVWNWVSGGRDPDDCIKPDAYFAQNYFACAGKAATTTGPQLSQAMHDSCRLYFRACYDRPAEMCAAMAATLGGLVGKIKSGLKAGAENITATALGAYLASREKDLCTFGYADRIDEAIDDFALTECQGLLKQRVPTNPNACPVHASAPPMVSPPYANACRNAAAAVGGKARDKMKEQCEAHCNANKRACEPPPPCADLLGHQYSPTHGAGCPLWGGVDDIRPVNPGRWNAIKDAGQQKIPDDFTIGGRHGLGRAGQTAGGFMIGNCKPAYLTDVVTSFGGGSGNWAGLKTVAVIGGFDSCGLGGSSPNRLTTIKSVGPLRPSVTPKSQSGGSSGASTVHQGGIPVNRGGNSAMDRLTGDNSMPYSGGSNYRLPDGNRPKIQQGTASGGSSGTYTVRGGTASGGSSGTYTVKPGGVPAQRPSGGSSGVSTVQPGGIPGQRSSGGSSGVSTVQPGGIPGQRSSGGSSGVSTVKPGGVPAERPSSGSGGLYVR